MELEDIILKFERFEAMLTDENITQMMGVCVGNTLDKQVDRIFNLGLKADGSQIGNYSTKPGIFGDGPKAVKKTDFQPFNSAQRAKTGKKGYFGEFFNDGYKGWKGSQGRNNSFVDLFLSGDLRRDYATSLTRDGDSWVVGVKRKENVDKIRGIIDKYGPEVFKLSDEEADFFGDCVESRLIQMFESA